MSIYPNRIYVHASRSAETPFRPTDDGPQQSLVFMIDRSTGFEGAFEWVVMLPDNHRRPTGKRHVASAWMHYQLLA